MNNAKDAKAGDYPLSPSASPKGQDKGARSKLPMDAISLNRRRWPWFFGHNKKGRSIAALTKVDPVTHRLT